MKVAVSRTNSKISLLSTMSAFQHMCNVFPLRSAIASHSKLLSRFCRIKILAASYHYDASPIPLTKERYTSVSREKFATVQEKDIQFFQNTLESSRVLIDDSDIAPYNVDWLKMVRGYGSCVLRPKTTEEVSAILRYCNERNLAVCPQGGNTGLVGGNVPVFDEVILSTSLMKEIISFDPVSGVLVCQAGCVKETLDNYVLEQGHMIPYDLGAKGSCQIGGNVSTNAGGLRLIRYGNLHGSILGVEAVLANGEVVDCLSTLKKDNTGYHLKHLFIGSEGTLGVVTKVSIFCPPSPAATIVAFLGLESFDKVLETFQEAKKDLGEILSSCEMMDADSAHSVVDNLGLRLPIEPHNFYMLIETSGSNLDHDQEKLSTFFERALDLGIIQDGTVTHDPSRINQLWECRERAAEALTKDGYAYMYDLSLPYSQYYNVVHYMREILPKDRILKCCGFGHIGDGNMHFNVTCKEFDPQVFAAIEPALFEWTARYGGSVSAEHGIGFMKREFIKYSKSGGALKLMKQIKTVMDPKGILNPYKVLPS